MNIHSPTKSRPRFILVDARTGGESASNDEPGKADLETGAAFGRKALLHDAAAEAIAVVTDGLNARTEAFQRSVPRFKAEVARINPDYPPQEILTALAL
jgi:hypothetical protein